MKLPKYWVETPQQCINLGFNYFALQLMAESFADAPEKFGDENVVFEARAHNGKAVYFIMTKTPPQLADFEAAKPSESPAVPDTNAPDARLVKDEEERL